MHKNLYLILGFLFLVVAGIGFILPVLPGTPFVLLAAWCFARSSEKWHQWLLQNKIFGPLIQNWEENRCISIRTKIVAIGSMLMVGGSSIVFGVDELWLRGLVAILITAGAVAVLSIRTCEKTS